MKKIRHWWGWELKEGDETIGFVDNMGGETDWKAVKADRQTTISTFKYRKDAIACVVSDWERDDTPSIFNGEFVTINQIREVMSDNEFRTRLFKDEIEIVDKNLGQPRHGEPFLGHRLFKLRKV